MQMSSLTNWKEGTKMLVYKVVITKTAQRDLLDIFDYIAFELCCFLSGTREFKSCNCYSNPL